MKKTIALLLCAVLCLSVFTACQSTTPSNQGESKSPASPVEITVVTSYGGDDGNRANYEEAFKAYEAATGNIVKDGSGTSNEEWKAKIMADFETGAEPDVLFFFAGVDANKLIENNKVVSIETIRSVYPDYASNMKEDILPISPADGKKYTVPVNGYWEGLYVNKKVLADCGVEVPGAGYTWDQFMADCETIKSKGYTPVAASLQEVPHYWFEFTVLNHGTVETHNNLPDSSSDETGKAWAAGLNDIKTMYEKGYFPVNTLTATDAEIFQMMADDKAAFAIDGSWKIGWFQENAKNIDDFTVTYVPGKNDRKATDVIGGLSMGYYITKKAWDDPVKQKAAVDFVTAMTKDDVVSKFGATAVTALKNGAVPPSNADSLMIAAIEMTKGSTGIAPATQDNLNQTARASLFANVKNIVTGSITAEAAIDEALAITE
jgi:raffinose/stachyose/melibiose transport system substrate-binding protein